MIFVKQVSPKSLKDGQVFYQRHCGGIWKEYRQSFKTTPLLGGLFNLYFIKREYEFDCYDSDPYVPLSEYKGESSEYYKTGLQYYMNLDVDDVVIHEGELKVVLSRPYKQLNGVYCIPTDKGLIHIYHSIDYRPVYLEMIRKDY